MSSDTKMMTKYDPWGPIWSIVAGVNDSDLVQRLIDFTGVGVKWPVLDSRTGVSAKTRIRAFRPSIVEAYAALPDDEKGRFAQIVAKQLLGTPQGESVKGALSASLRDIGWDIATDGTLRTDDALLSEQFFPAGTVHDAYVAIRDILHRATKEVMVVDPYLGGPLFRTLSSAPQVPAAVKLLTTSQRLKGDFLQEARLFQQQFASTRLDVGISQAFHDRFIVIDTSDVYHVGASIKDAGKKAFLLSRIEDPPVRDSIARYVTSAWEAAERRSWRNSS